jgi:hypothetical protein
LLLAAHCLHDTASNGISSRFLAGQDLYISTDKVPHPDQSSYFPVHIVQTHVPQTWFDACTKTPCGVNVLTASHPPDVALIVVDTETPQIPEAWIDPNPVQPGDGLVIGGYGCETDVGKASEFDYSKSRLKVSHVAALPASSLLHRGTSVAAGDEDNVAASYVISEGASLRASAASLCPGDSGGPAYRDDAEQRTIVGVNAYYSFPPTSGVATTNWHTRLDDDSRYGIGPWLRALGVNFLGEDLPLPTPRCDGRTCGPDGAGGVCGACAENENCDAHGQCIAAKTACEDTSQWDSTRIIYTQGERAVREGRLYECNDIGQCFRDPASEWGHYGWTDLGPC